LRIIYRLFFKEKKKLSKYRRFNHMFFQNTLGEREREVWLELAISAMFSSLEIKGNEYWTSLLEGWTLQGQGQYHVIDH
jgi:hypothetical protein